MAFTPECAWCTLLGGSLPLKEQRQKIGRKTQERNKVLIFERNQEEPHIKPNQNNGWVQGMGSTVDFTSTEQGRQFLQTSPTSGHSYRTNPAPDLKPSE